MDNVNKATELADLIDGYCCLLNMQHPQSLITKRAGKFLVFIKTLNSFLQKKKI